MLKTGLTGIAVGLIAAAIALPASADFKDDWKELILAAQKEGKLVLAAVPGTGMRRKMPEIFENKFGVKLEVVVTPSRQTAQRAIREAKAGAQTIDVFSTGQSTLIRVLYPKGLLAPIKPLLIHPDVINNKAAWMKGEPWFLDDKRAYMFRAVDLVIPMAFVNTKFVDPNGFNNTNDFLDPKYKGKIVVYDPTRPGPGSNAISYYMKFLGDQFVIDLIKGQNAKLTRSRRQLVDWLAQGRYPIAFAASINEIGRLRREGFKIAAVQPKNIISYDAPGSGVLALLRNSPHPKAAQLFLNWIMTKEGMQLYQDLEGMPVTRIDINRAGLMVPETIPQAGVKYFDTADYAYVTQESKKLFGKLKRLLKR
jgi:iron(III) transport system substrate-binding protein